MPSAGASWALIAWLPTSLILLIVGIIVIELAGQVIHVTNQQLIVEIDPHSSSRIIGSNMVYYAIGTGLGAIAATITYRHGAGPPSAFSAQASAPWHS